MDNIEEILSTDKSDFRVRKTLYMSSHELINLKTNTSFKEIKENIFQYKDMKIVIIEM